MSPDLSQGPDKELAAAACAGHEGAYRALLARHKASVFGLIVRQVGDADEAMDLTQETFVAAFAAIDRYDDARPFRIWIGRIAINKCRDWARRRKVRAFFARALPSEAAHAVAGDAPLPDREAGDRSELARVRAALARLPRNLREVLILRGVEEVSQAEAAAMLDISEKAVETRLYRARTRLKILLEEAGDRTGN